MLNKGYLSLNGFMNITNSLSFRSYKKFCKRSGRQSFQQTWVQRWDWFIEYPICAEHMLSTSHTSSPQLMRELRLLSSFYWANKRDGVIQIRMTINRTKIWIRFWILSKSDVLVGYVWMLYVYGMHVCVWGVCSVCGVYTWCAWCECLVCMWCVVCSV